MTAMEILERLDERFRLLTGGRRGSRNHHQTLRQTVDWSYELLNESEKLVLQRLSVFAGSFDLAAVEAVAGDGLSRYETDDTLESLVAKSLVVTATGGARSRYSLLETIRQYAAEHLSDAGGMDAVRASHANHYIERATDLGAQLLGPHEFAAVASGRLETRNFRAVFEWAVDAGNVDTAFELITPFFAAGIFRHPPVSRARRHIADAPGLSRPRTRGRPLSARYSLRGDLWPTRPDRELSYPRHGHRLAGREPCAGECVGNLGRNRRQV